MNNETITVPTASRSGAERMFPVLSPAHIERIAALGLRRSTRQDEILAEVGDIDVPFFVVVSGEVCVEQVAAASSNQDGTQGITVVATHKPGGFTGEANMLSGRPALVRARVSRPGEVIELDRNSLLELVQTDSEISEILMRAFILRRVELIAHGLGDVVVIGSNHCAGTLRVKEFLDRNVHPFTYIDLDSDADVQGLLDRFHVSPSDVPVVIGRGTVVMRNPGNHEIAASLGFNEVIDATSVRDVVIVGAGPAGLAAAVYAASEGLSVLMVETQAPGGQSGSSSKIENYLGFPTGISGRALSARAYAQAQKFGAKIVIAESAIRLECSRKPYAIVLDSGTRVSAHTVVIASGAEYRKPPLENLAQFEGMGVYYAATHMEAQLCADEEVIVVGGGNSAGQAAVFLAQSVKHVHVLVRSKGLAESMSRYLIHRIELHARITLWSHSEIVALDGDSHLRHVQWKNSRTGALELRPIRHLFLMTGADPCTRWLEGCLALDAKGFIRTGPELSAEDLAAAHWPADRSPLLLETNRPGIFAVGDVRAGNIKRVASAVGEGSISIALVHQVLGKG